MAKRTPKTRIERDSMGDMEVPSHVLYGASTQRALLNYPYIGKNTSILFDLCIHVIKTISSSRKP